MVGEQCFPYIYWYGYRPNDIFSVDTIMANTVTISGFRALFLSKSCSSAFSWPANCRPEEMEKHVIYLGANQPTWWCNGNIIIMGYMTNNMIWSRVNMEYSSKRRPKLDPNWRLENAIQNPKFAPRRKQRRVNVIHAVGSAILFNSATNQKLQLKKERAYKYRKT